MTQAKFIWPGLTPAADVPAKTEKPKSATKAKKELPVGHARLSDVLTAPAMKAALDALPEDMDGLTLHGIGASRAGPVVPLVKALKPKFADAAKIEAGKMKTGQFSKIRDAALRLVEKQTKGDHVQPLVLENARALTAFALNVKFGETPKMTKETEIICVLVPLAPGQSPTPGE